MGFLSGSFHLYLFNKGHTFRKSPCNDEKTIYDVVTLIILYFFRYRFINDEIFI